MPYDPSLPLPNSPLESQVIRDQLQALFNLINNILTVTAAQVDGVNTVEPGNPANAASPRRMAFCIAEDTSLKL